MTRFLSSGAPLVLMAIALPILAQEPPKSAGPKLLTPEVALNLRNISDLQFSADGSRLAFVVTEPARGERRARHIWIYEKQSGTIRQFTYSAKSEFLPRWSPDGKQLAFLSDRDEQQQVYAMRTGGGEATALTKGKRGVKSFEWSPNGKQIAFLAPDAKTEAEEKKEKDKDDARVVDKDDKHARVWLLDVAATDSATPDPRAMTKATWNVDSLAWMPSGDQLILQATDHPEVDQYTEKIYSMQISDGLLKALIAPRGPFFGIRISPDGKGISYV